MTLDIVVGGIGMAAAIVAAALWLYASLIAPPDNLDTFIGELQRIARLNAYAAWAAVVAALCAAYLFGRQNRWL
ncbi:MAG TPA: hypothetical protein VFU31_10670 [Candidatus Binatia bacterium]|nr:hypothetical protein [Candidatus Binatia bacterium]